MTKEVLYILNSKYFKDFGVFISESKGLLDKPKLKSRRSYDWAEYHGKAVDLAKPKYDEREIELKGWVEGETWSQMKTNFDTLLSEFDKEGLARLVIEYLGNALVFDVYLSDGVELEKSFKEGKMVGVFTLKMKDPNPIKRVFKLVGSDLQLSFNAQFWVDINIDGINETRKGNITINKTVPSRELSGYGFYGRNLMLTPRIYNGYAVEASTSTPLIEGQEYVISFDIKGQNDGVLFLNNSIKVNIPINPSPNEWFRVSKVFTFIKNDYQGKEIFPHIYGATDVRKVKLEKGNKATGYTPAPEDTHYITISGNTDEITNLQTNAEELWSL
ncbi:putative phage tail protein [Riemerella phage RAP44]|uniref:tail protein n=1 Tax=Riemerella phage RAP44 TaxID=936152 RepID=UPI0002078584|nr:tail protein [Riemerella phage RAP44]AEB71693.1 putative phage tail protein [Riemerella phage RAP44]WGH49509.1 tail protein [Riemerella phage vB_RanS_CRP2]